MAASCYHVLSNICNAIAPGFFCISCNIYHSVVYDRRLGDSFALCRKCCNMPMHVISATARAFDHTVTGTNHL